MCIKLSTYVCYHNKSQINNKKNDEIWFFGPNGYLNEYLSEFSMFYWIWKNDKDSKYITVCHYKRRIYSNRFDINKVNNNSCQCFHINKCNYTSYHFFKNIINNDCLLNDYKEYIKIKYNKYVNFDYNKDFFIQYSCVTLTSEHFMNMCDYIFGFFEYINQKYKLNYERKKIDIFISKHTIKINRKWFNKKRMFAYMMEMMVSLYITSHIKEIYQIE